jgi:hypothetical protein
MEETSVWDEITKDWPKLILLKNLESFPEFPYSGQYFRNLVTGKKCDADLKKAIVRIGKYPAIPKTVLVGWLAGRTVEAWQQKKTPAAGR